MTVAKMQLNKLQTLIDSGFGRTNRVRVGGDDDEEEEVDDSFAHQYASLLAAQKVEKEVEGVVEACDAFLSRFVVNDKPPDKVEEEQERAYITCRFHLARAHGKLDTPAALGAALKEYQLIRDYLKRNKVDGMEQEAQVCGEMAELLPHKIAAAERGMLAQGA